MFFVFYTKNIIYAKDKYEKICPEYSLLPQSSLHDEVAWCKDNGVEVRIMWKGYKVLPQPTSNPPSSPRLHFYNAYSFTHSFTFRVSDEKLTPILYNFLPSTLNGIAYSLLLIWSRASWAGASSLNSKT